VETAKLFESATHGAGFQTHFMSHPGVTIHCLIRRDANYVEKSEKKSPLGAGFRPDAHATLAIQ
jgi:hypothetical protein